MRRLLLTMTIVALTATLAPTAHAARATNLRVTTAPSWEQWIEQGTLREGHLGIWEQTACSRTEPRISYTLARTSEPPTATGPVQVGYAGVLFPLTLGPRVGGAAQRHELPFGPVSVSLPDAFYGQAGRDPNNTPVNQIGRWVLSFYVDTGAPGDIFRNWRTVNYRGVKKPAGACAAAGLDTYNVLAAAP
ncbi:hypothetical protein LRS13_24860 [Svornostia abyssi]|uniref:Uncharacterized protein n=1 Tax=Svornostia abyssi TaxID=2898438 RepID=A0ABY5PGQ5_9ACTN|nr:hypothetical protein LRS13_24860 [Parviterribacteraceae bacterium J379]